MKTLRERLVEADPLRHESGLAPERRDHVRQAVVARARPMRRRPRRVPALAAVAALLLMTSAAAGLLWSRAAVDVAAAIRFEVRLAENEPAPGLREAAVASSGRVVYLHPEPLVENGDITGAEVSPGDGGAMAVAVIFSEEAAARMLRATEQHLGRPIAILLDGELVAAPVVRSPISDSAVITGRYSRADAERIAAGVLGV
jgi:hypothetical protein